jgi:hypothetical protein
VHALAVPNNECTEFLPFVDPEERKKFRQLRMLLKKQYQQVDVSWIGRLKYWLTNTTSTGIRPYAFTNDKEFLTVTLDEFMSHPHKLCKTAPGKELYTLYQNRPPGNAKGAVLRSA